MRRKIDKTFECGRVFSQQRKTFLAPLRRGVSPKEIGRDAGCSDSATAFFRCGFYFFRRARHLGGVLRRYSNDMTEYEIFYVVGDSKKVELGDIKKSVEAAIVAEGGEMAAGEFVDERRMEYAIRGERRGTYIAKRFTTVSETGSDIPGAISKRLSLLGGVLRSIIVRAEGLPTLEESQDRVRRVPDMRRKSPGRYQLNRPRLFQNTPAPELPAKPAMTDTEIDKKLGEVLDI